MDDWNLEKLVADFKKLEHEEKKERILQMIQINGTEQDYVKEVVSLIQGAPEVSDEYLEEVYLIIMKSWLEQIKKEHEEMATTILKKIKKLTIDHCNAEENEKKWLDSILENL